MQILIYAWAVKSLTSRRRSLAFALGYWGVIFVCLGVLGQLDSNNIIEGGAGQARKSNKI